MTGVDLPWKKWVGAKFLSGRGGGGVAWGPVGGTVEKPGKKLQGRIPQSLDGLGAPQVLRIPGRGRLCFRGERGPTLKGGGGAGLGVWAPAVRGAGGGGT